MSEQPDQASTQPSRKKPLGFDEMIAILVAFGAIGSILFWGLTRQTEEPALNLGEPFNPLAASPVEGLLSPQSSNFSVVSPVAPATALVTKPSVIAQGNVPATVPATIPATVPSTQPNRVSNGNFIGAVVPAGIVRFVLENAGTGPCFFDNIR